MKQGQYQPGEITVLTAYVGQLLLLKSMLSKDLVVTLDERDADLIAEEAARGEGEESNIVSFCTAIVCTVMYLLLQRYCTTEYAYIYWGLQIRRLL